MTYDLTTEHGRAQAHADGSPLAGIVEKALAESACEQLQEVSQLLEKVEAYRIFGACRQQDFDLLLDKLEKEVGESHTLYREFFDLQTECIARHDDAMNAIEALEKFLASHGVR